VSAAATAPADGAWLERLFPFQADGARALVRSDALLLADDMGLGKTIQAIAALRRLSASGDLGKVLLVVPSSLIAQWRAQLYDWAPELRFSTVRGTQSDRAWQWRAPADIHIVGYETLRSDFSLNPHSPVGREWDVVILDEAQ
jgi:SNF2 family DNA or RNA helicase